MVLVNVDAGAPGRTEQARNFSRSDDWTVLVPELGQQARDITVTKKTWGAFSSTDLDSRLKKLGVTQVVVAGVSTSAGVESTARHAHKLDYNVTLATDAMTDMSADAHGNSISRIFPRIGETGTSRGIIELLDAQAAHSRSQ